MNFLEPFHIPPLAQKRFMELLSDCLTGSMQQPGADWDDFLNRHSLLCRKLLHLVEKNPAGVRFPTKRNSWTIGRPNLAKIRPILNGLLRISFSAAT